MTDPRYAASDVSDSTAAPEPGPQDEADHTGRDNPAHDNTPKDDPAHDATANDSPANHDPASAPDPQATTELPRTNWEPPRSDAQSNSQPDSQPDSQANTQPDSQSGAQSGAVAQPGAAPSWTSDQTQDFPAYRPQSYPTYPPIQSQTSELPAVSGAGAGPPPSSAAAYASPYGAAGAGIAPGAATAAAAGPVRRNGAGIAGALGLIGLAGAAAGAFALPIERFAQNQNAYFGNFHDLALRTVRSSAANNHSVSLVGTHIATVWWHYAAEAALGALAFVLLVQLCVPVLRRVAGVVLLLGGLATAAAFLYAAHQTNDYRSSTLLGTPRRISWHHLAYGFWVAIAGCVVIALAGLIAAAQSTRR